MKIHQFVHTLTFGDAISDEVRSIQRLLRAEGVESEIYCVHCHTMFEGRVKDYRNFEKELSEDPTAVVMHYSIGSPLNALFLAHPEIRRVMIYHNLTPQKWFESYNPRVTADLRRGREELPRIVHASDLCLADSRFNEEDLIAYGAKRSAVLPLLVDLEKWSVPANAGIDRALRGRACKNIVHVGRFAPNKCLEDIIKAFYFYHHKINERSHLWLVGSEIDTELYGFELRNLVRELRLQDAVSFPGAVADSEVKAIYQNASLYLCMSEHEGFCVPLIEAMHFGIPVIAFNSSAVGETLGDGGILVQKKHPAELAELMHLVVDSPDVRDSMIARGGKRVEQFSEREFRKNLKRQLVEPLFATS